MKQYLRSDECRLPDKDKTVMLKFLSRNLISQISYPFVKKYHYRKVNPVYDPTNAMYYILHHGKKLYFRKSWDKIKICNMYNELCAEQDMRSPHSYQNFPIQYLHDDIVVDAGAAEGIWALDVIDKVKTVYLFEYEKEWIEALRATFAPWKDKTIIVSAYISDNSNGFGKITLDDYFCNRNVSPTIIKADIEGSETDMLKGSPIVFSKSTREAVICTYHNVEDYEILLKMMTQFGFQINRSDGYMFSIYSELDFHCKDISQIIRKGLIYGFKK
jgi:predicted RNA methylase